MYKVIYGWSNIGRTELDVTECHPAKSLAGWAFKTCSDGLRSVCVVDKETGQVELYMNKDRPRSVWVGAN